MPLLQRDALEASPLADLHELASEAGLEGYRRLRKAELIDRLLDGTKADDSSSNGAKADADEKPRRTRGGRGRGARAEKDDKADADEAPKSDSSDDDEDDEPRGGRPRGRSRRNARDDDEPKDEGGERQVDGVVEVLGNGTGFVRVKHPEQSDDDVYVSAAQVRRCELVSGDKIAGPYRAPRRSERYPSLVRVETINGKPAEEVAGEATRFDDLPSTYPVARFELGSDDVTLKAIEWLAPIGRGSRVVVHGPAHAGKTETLRLLAGALKGSGGIELSLVLAGARPEELTAWAETGVEPAATAALGGSLESQIQAIERTVDQARRLAQRGTDAVVLIDSLGELAPHVARRVLSTARNLVEGGSVTIIATAPAPLGGETTLIALDPARGTARFDLAKSSTIRPDLLVGADGAAAIAEAKAKAL